MSSICDQVYYLPLIACSILPITFAITYGIAVTLKHVEPVWPYISDTGSLSPENCIFGQFLNMTAVLIGVCVYFRYKQTEECMKLMPALQITPAWNKIATWIGFLSCFALDVVANFQESHLLIVHLIAAVSCFSFGTMYFTLQAVFSLRLYPTFASKRICFARILCSTITTLFTLSTIVPVPVSLLLFDGSIVKMWSPEDGGWEYHITSSFSEWLLVMSYCAQILIFVWEFKNIEVSAPSVKVLGVHFNSNDMPLNEQQGETMGVDNVVFENTEETKVTLGL